ncbi:MAG TPA: cupin domain-containing protein [Gaiellaceae bacterium]
MANIFEDRFSGRLDLSSDETAMFVYDVDPGDSFPYHYEYVEEWLLVIDGAVVVRVPDGERELARGEILRFPPGPEGAHQITNRSDAPARVLLWSKAALPGISVYPDTDAVGVWPDDDTEFYFKRSTSVSREDAV